MEIHRVDNLEAYQRLQDNYQQELKSLTELETALLNKYQSLGSYYFDGYSWPLKSPSKFLIDGQYAPQGQINWRERLVCHKTQLNNRIRGALHVFEQACRPEQHNSIYLTEQHTLLYKWFNKHYQHVVGSEYLSDSGWFNRFKFRVRLFPDALVHQDLTQLTFPDEAFNYVLSFDCFEHIPDYQTALKELHRVMKAGGKLLFSVPFDRNSATTLIRAAVAENGHIIHHLEPEYHGNPVSKQGSLSYYTFGWDLLDLLKTVGFKQAYAMVYWSEQHAYLGGPQLLLCAEK